MRKLGVSLLIAFSVLSVSGIARADVPTTMTVQGRLTDSSGAPVTGAATLVFKIFISPSDTREIWPQQGANDEAHAVVLDPGGLWTVEIGTEYPITTGVFSNSSRWLEVQHVESGTIFPRVNMTTGSYAFKVGTVEGATGGNIYGDVFLHSTFYVGALGDAGHVVVRDATTYPQIKLDGAEGAVEARNGINLVDIIDGAKFAGLGRNGNGGGVLRTWDENGDQTVILGSTASGDGAFANFHMANSIWAGVAIDGDDGNGGRLYLARPDGGGFDQNITLDADAGDGGATFEMRDGTNRTIWFDANAGEGGGGFLMYNSQAVNTIELDADEGDVGVFRLFDEGGSTRVRLHAAGTSGGGQLLLVDDNGTTTVALQAAEGTTGAQLALYNDAGTATIVLDAEQGDGGSGRVITQVLQITGGADLSEQFEINAHSSGLAPAPGMVVCLDAQNPGQLIVSDKAYDRTVAGIVSGAGGVNPGMLMGQHDSEADGTYPVALSGRVYVMADAANGPIAVGDMLTTSNVPGHAMKVTDYDRAHGTIIGKAMSSLESGRGLVLALVSLQ